MAASGKDFYKVLEVNEKATPDAIKKAYRTLAKKHHPDAKALLMSGYTHGAETAAGKIGEDYNLLQKPFTRGELNSCLRRLIDETQPEPVVAARA